MPLSKITINFKGENVAEAQEAFFDVWHEKLRTIFAEYVNTHEDFRIESIETAGDVITIEAE